MSRLDGIIKRSDNFIHSDRSLIGSVLRRLAWALSARHRPLDIVSKTLSVGNCLIDTVPSVADAFTRQIICPTTNAASAVIRRITYNVNLKNFEELKIFSEHTSRHRASLAVRQRLSHTFDRASRGHRFGRKFNILNFICRVNKFVLKSSANKN